jgi:hypothetical protein
VCSIILEHDQQIDQQYKEKVATLMNPEFQNFKNYKTLPA